MKKEEEHKVIRWGIIGCGNVTEVKSGPPYQNTNGFKLVAVMRRNEALAADYAKRHSVPNYYSDADLLINSNDVDAVYIATPPDTHLYYGKKVANAGKPCCVEKPMAPSYKESLALYNAFNEKNIPFFVAYYRRSLPRFTKIKEWLDAKQIGDVRHISWHLTKPASETDLNKDPNWRTDAKVAPGGYFDDLASHGLDLFAYLLGDFELVHGIATNQQKLYSAKDAITACWLHKNGITGEGAWNFGSYNRADKVEIIGNEGVIEFSVFDENDVVLKNKNGVVAEFINHPKHVQEFHVEKIATHLFGKGAHPSSGATALHTSWVMDKILGNI